MHYTLYEAISCLEVTRLEQHSSWNYSGSSLFVVIQNHDVRQSTHQQNFKQDVECDYSVHVDGRKKESDFATRKRRTRKAGKYLRRMQWCPFLSVFMRACVHACCADSGVGLTLNSTVTKSRFETSLTFMTTALLAARVIWNNRRKVFFLSRRLFFNREVEIKVDTLNGKRWRHKIVTCSPKP